MKKLFIYILFVIAFISTKNAIAQTPNPRAPEHLDSDTLRCEIYYPSGQKKMEFHLVDKCVNGPITFYDENSANYVEGHIKNDCKFIIMNDLVFSLTDSTYNQIKTGNWAYTIGPYTMLRSFK